MTPSPARALPIAMVNTAVVPPQRVYVRPTGRTAQILPFAFGWLTHRRTLGTMTISVTVQFEGGDELDCPPPWVTPAFNWESLIHFPKPAGAP